MIGGFILNKNKTKEKEKLYDETIKNHTVYCKV